MSSWSSDKVASESYMSNYTQIATIIVGVGEEQKKWCIPTDLLCYQSGYFRGALRRHFIEAKEQKVELPDIDPRTFKFIVEWLYSHIVHKPCADSDDARTGLLIDAWVLADYLQMPRLQNAIMELMDTCIFESVRIPIEEFQRVFGNYDRSSAFRRWMVDCCTWALDRNDAVIQECVDLSATEILKDEDNFSGDDRTVLTLHPQKVGEHIFSVARVVATAQIT
ncbi:hypothetical protein VE02_08193 [Pseudogymnoascus sp. 03VT05]|nr:hypothetical protein VE02_08193 [Pseudogymnoascus sp. 03VT05]